MKKHYLIGLGGSGGKVITALYERIREEHGENFALNQVECIAIDTDQEDLNKLAQLGVKKVCISGPETVGQIINQLGDDVTDWCPNTANEGNFYSSPVFNGASQCRLKSRLCFSSYIKNENNALKAILEESRQVSAHGEDAVDGQPTILIVSSIAGGTGSGIFIQTALYIKKIFKKFNIDVTIHGLFACPELYKNVVNHQQIRSLFANAYAVVRELNAFNLICGGKDADGSEYDIDIEISTSCEGKLFEKDAEGRYGDKPYDAMYFIDKINYLSRTLGGLDNYYHAMADIAYSHLYTDISTAVLSAESNEMNSHSVAPTAIYGSAGASTLIYPYEDILTYFASRSIAESVSTLWAVLDQKWHDYLDAKNASAIAAGYARYTPKPEDRGDEYIASFDNMVKKSGMAPTEMRFLAPMVEKDGACFADILLNAICAKAEECVMSDERIKMVKEAYGLSDIGNAYSALCSNVDEFSKLEDDADIFAIVKDIDSGLESYCRKSLEYTVDSAISFANLIYCDNSEIWDSYDKQEKEINLVYNLIFNQETGEWNHPVAARYLLYRFADSVKKKMSEIFSDIDSAKDDVQDFLDYMNTSFVEEHKRVLSPNDEDFVDNAQILQDLITRPFKKRATKKYIGEYFENLEVQLEEIDRVISDALIYFSLSAVYGRVKKLIEVYEAFFDNLDDFVDKANTETNANLCKHDKSTSDVYVCASAEVKEYLYEAYSRSLNANDGATASLINQALFSSLRLKASASAQTNNPIMAKKIALKKNKGDIFDKTLEIIVSNAKNNVEISENLDKNVFEALLLEYKLKNPEHEDDIQNYPDADAAAERNRVDQFMLTKFSSLVKASAPCLLFDCSDTYDAMQKTADVHGSFEAKPKVTNSYRFLSQNRDVYNSIVRFVSGSTSASAVADFYDGIANELPDDTDGQTVKFSSVTSSKVNKYSILCYATVHCLQPYQIKAFDELKGGEYYKHYAERIAEMERVQKYSMTPHLDKSWHKHGRMPYINVKKENEHRVDLAKAFLYALTHGAIGYHMETSYAQFVYADSSIGRTPELMFHDGKPIPYNKVNRAIAWLADNEELVEIYAERYDALLNAELDKLIKYSDTVAGYKTGITNYSKLLRQMKRNMLRAVQLRPSKNGTEKTLKEKESISVLELAWQLHFSEESELDKNYGELIIAMLCNTIKEYAKAPYNARKIEQEDKGSDAYNNYLDICDHIADSFIDVFAKELKSTAKSKKAAEDEKPKAAAKSKKAKKDDEPKEAFGITNEDLRVTQVKSADDYDGKLEWAAAEIRKHILDIDE